MHLILQNLLLQDSIDLFIHSFTQQTFTESLFCARHTGGQYAAYSLKELTKSVLEREVSTQTSSLQ